MKYYHGSKNGELKQLTLEKSNDGYIYLTSNYAAAVFYGGAPIRFWSWNKQKQIFIVREMCRGGLKKLYKGVSCWLYLTENVGEFENDYYMGCPSIKMKHSVDLPEKEFVPDVYKKFLELEKQGQLEIFWWKQHTKQQKEKAVENVKFLISKTDPQKYPDDWKALQSIYPKLCKQAQ